MTDINKELRRECEPAKPGSLHPAGSEATWWVYYLTVEGKTEYLTAIPLPIKRAMAHQRAIAKYHRGKYLIQITETPPNS